MQSDINMKIFKIFYKEHYYQRDCREAFYETLRPKKNLETMGSRGENYACNQLCNVNVSLKQPEATVFFSGY